MASPVASTSSSAAAELSSKVEPESSSNATSGAARPLRTEAEYHTEEDDEGEDSDKALLLDTEKTGELLRTTRLDSMTAFDFNDRILLATSADVGLNGGRLAPPAEPISVIGGVALIVGMQIGSGIFSSPGIVASETGSVGSALILWTGAGMLSWAGASSFAELGSALPINGGAQAYLAAAYGPIPAYCFSFTAVVALKPGGQAIIATILGEYLGRIMYHTAFSANPHEAARGVSPVVIKLTALFSLILIGGLHSWSTKAGTRTQLILTIFKVLALVLVFAGGLVFLGLGRAASDFSFKGSTHHAAGYALALFSALWTFDGWDQANYVAKDCKTGSLPVIINSSLATVVVLFLCANVSYFLVLPFAVATATSTIGLDFGRAIAGPIGGVIFALIVSVSCLGAMNGSLYTSSRLIVAAAEQGFLPKLFSHYHPRQGTPINGILLSSGLSVLFIIFGDFAKLTLFYGVCAWTWNLAVVVGLLVLRVREPSLKRPYRTWLATPILFACTALFLIVLSCFSKPWESLAAFVFILAGSVPYYFQTRRQKEEVYDLELS